MYLEVDSVSVIGVQSSFQWLLQNDLLLIFLAIVEEQVQGVPTIYDSDFSGE